MPAIDPTFTMNDYGKPKMLTNLQTYVNNIMMLLFGKPGFYPSIPSIGMDITQYLYKFQDEIDTSEIKSKLAAQCSEFLPEIQNGDIDIFSSVYDGRLVLIFKLPSITDDKSFRVAIGITTNTRGEIVFNFVENDETQVL